MIRTLLFFFFSTRDTQNQLFSFLLSHIYYTELQILCLYLRSVGILRDPEW
jgi:hypothetical protein